MRVATSVGPDCKNDTIEHMVDSPSHRLAVAAAFINQWLVPFFVGSTSTTTSMSEANVKMKILKDLMDL